MGAVGLCWLLARFGVNGVGRAAESGGNRAEFGAKEGMGL